jgi:hypothetical protein
MWPAPLFTKTSGSNKVLVPWAGDLRVVFVNLQMQLVSEGLIKTQEAKQSLWQRLFPAVLRPSLKPAFGGAIVALLLSTTVFYFYSQRGSQEVRVSSEAQVFQELQQAELHYQKAIEALSEVSKRKIELDPAMAQILNDNLATMDYYVKECQDAVKSSPTTHWCTDIY